MKHSEDDLFRALADLRGQPPDAEWEELLRARCHRKIALRRSRRAIAGRGGLAEVLIQATAFGVGFAYLVAVLHMAVGLAIGN